MATQTTHYVDLDLATGANDGTSWANAFRTLAAWKTHAARDLTAVDQWEDCQLRGSTTAHAATLDIDGWTTDATRYIKFTVDSEDRHAGVWSDTKFRIAVSDAYVMYIRENYVWFDGVQFACTATTSSRYLFGTISLGASNWLRFSNCLIRGHGNASYHQQFSGLISGERSNLQMYNCAIYGFGTYATSYLILNAAHGAVELYNVTFIGGGTNVFAGIRNDGATSVTCVNCYSGNVTNHNAYYGTITQTNCAASDDSAAGTNPHDSVPYDTNTFVSVTPATDGTGDYLKLTSGGGLTGHGADGPFSAPFDYTTDIAGTTRS